MKRSGIQHMPQFFDRYILLTDDIDIIELITNALYHTERCVLPETTKRAFQDEWASRSDFFCPTNWYYCFVKGIFRPKLNAQTKP